MRHRAGHFCNRVAGGVDRLASGKIATKNVQVQRRGKDEEFRIKAVPGELRQVFFNLLANSVDAVGPEGETAIRISKFSASDKPHLRVTFADNGSGIAGQA